MNNKINNIPLLLFIVVIIGLLYTIYSKHVEIDDLRSKSLANDSIYFKMILEEDTIIRSKTKDIDSLRRVNLGYRYQVDSLMNQIIYINQRINANKTKYNDKLKAIDSLDINGQLKYFKENLYKN